jgi:hypothetical protein
MLDCSLPNPGRETQRGVRSHHSSAHKQVAPANMGATNSLQGDRLGLLAGSPLPLRFLLLLHLPGHTHTPHGPTRDGGLHDSAHDSDGGIGGAGWGFVCTYLTASGAMMCSMASVAMGTDMKGQGPLRRVCKAEACSNIAKGR